MYADDVVSHMGMGPQLLKSLIRQTGEARDWPWDPWFTWQEAYPLHHGGFSTDPPM